MKKNIYSRIITTAAIAATLITVALPIHVSAAETQNEIIPIEEITITVTVPAIDGTPGPDYIADENSTANVSANAEVFKVIHLYCSATGEVRTVTVYNDGTAYDENHIEFAGCSDVWESSDGFLWTVVK